MTRRTKNEGISVEFQPMSPEEMQRMMQFLLNQQARFEANFAKSQEQFDARMEKLSAKTDRITDGLIGLASIVGQLASAQQRTDEQLKESDHRWREADARLEEHIDRVESHLNVVVDMFDRHLREDHGHPPA